LKTEISKIEIRKAALASRSLLSPVEVREKSTSIISSVVSLPQFILAELILGYASYGNEVRTHALIESAWGLNKGVYLPKVCQQEVLLDVYRVHTWLDLKRGYKGLLQPKRGCEQLSDVQRLDLVFVPGVAFDTQGNRLGHGKGFFDRLLSQLLPTTVVVGLAFDCQIVPFLPREKHDVLMHMVVTETRIIACGSG